MTRRTLLRLSASAFASSVSLPAATCVSELDPQTAAEYAAYLDQMRPQLESPLDPGAMKPVALGGEPQVWNLNASDPRGVLEKGRGVIIHWAGAIRIRIPNIDALERTLMRYDMYSRWYQPYMAECRATPTSPDRKQFRVITVLHDILEKPAPLMPDMHFSFEVESAAVFRRVGAGPGTTQLVTNHAVKIRESDGGHPNRADSRDPKNDLMRPEYGHGVLWRSDTQWRAITSGNTVYAEYDSISLARSVDGISFGSPCALLRLPGLRNKALHAMTERPQKLVTTVLRQTRAACEQA